MPTKTTEKRRFLTKAEILQANDAAYQDVEVPEWGAGAYVRVRSLTAHERDRFESSLVTGEGKKQKTSTEKIRAKLCVLAIVGEDGQPLFDESDLNVLGAKSAAALDRVFQVAARLSKITDADIEELQGNSDGARRGAS